MVYNIYFSYFFHKVKLKLNNMLKNKTGYPSLYPILLNFFTINCSTTSLSLSIPLVYSDLDEISFIAPFTPPSIAAFAISE